LPPEQQPSASLFRNNSLDRGTLVRRANVSWGTDQQTAKRAGEATFFYTNATPQLADLNQRSWAQLEEELLNYIEEHDLKASIFSGPVFAESDLEYRGIKIPQAFWKVMVADVNGEAHAVGYLLEQKFTEAGDDVRGTPAAFDAINSRIDIAKIEALTHVDFGPVREMPTLQFR
jgi:endonuclease G